MSKSKTPPTDPQPPEGLSKPVLGWWRAVNATFELEPHHHKLLAMACEALETWHTATAAVREHGLTYVDRFGAPRARPEVAIVRDSRTAFARLTRELNLDNAEAPEAPRPPQIGGRYQRTP